MKKKIEITPKKISISKKSISFSKNVSRTVKNGTILQTRDEFLHNEGGYRKKGYEKKGNYRKVGVIDSNRNDELAIVKLHKPDSESGTLLPSKKARYKPFVETLDNESKRIKIGPKFIKSKQTLSNEDITAIKKDCYSNPKSRYKNKKKVRKLKGRK